MKKVGRILLAILPGLMLTAFTFIISQIVQLIVTVKYVAQGGAADTESLVAYLTDYLQGDRLLMIVIVAQLLTALVATLIIIKGMKKKEVFQNAVYAVKGLNGVSIVMIGISLEIVISMILLLVQLLAPGALDNYSSMIEQSGLAGFTVISTIATVIVAPLAEEITFRGLTVKILEKTGWNFWVVNTIQAVLFGVYHLNLVQGLYAFALGFVLGLMAKKCKTLWASILGHAVFNFSGTYIISLLSLVIDEKVIAAVIPLVIALIAAAFGLYLLLTKSVAPAEVVAVDEEKTSSPE